MVFTTEGFFEVAIESSYRRSNRLSYQAMSSTRTQSNLPQDHHWATDKGCSLIHPMFITTLLLVQPKDYLKPSN